MKKILLILGTAFFFSLTWIGIQLPEVSRADDAPVDPYSPVTGVAYAQVIDYYKLAVRTKVEASAYAVKKAADCSVVSKKEKGGNTGVGFSSVDTAMEPVVPCDEQTGGKDYSTYGIEKSREWDAICKKEKEDRPTGKWQTSFVGRLQKETCDLYTEMYSTSSTMMKDDTLGWQGPVKILDNELRKEYSKLAGYMATFASDIQNDCQKEKGVALQVVSEDMAVYAPRTYDQVAGIIARCNDEITHDLSMLSMVKDNIVLVFNEFVQAYPQHVFLKKMEKEFRSYIDLFKNAMNALDTIDAQVPGQVDMGNTKQ